MTKKTILKDIVKGAVKSSAKQISGYDAAFLYAESPSSPMHVGTLTIVEGSLKFEDFKEIIASKLHLIPKFRQRLMNVPFNLDYPYWVDDPNFDLDLHLHRMKLPNPADWKTLREVTSSLFSNTLDQRRPLWSVSFIEGLDEITQIPKGSVGIVTKVHHVMIDGSSGVGIMGLLFDNNAKEEAKKIPKPKPFEPDPLPAELSLLLKSSYKFIKNPLKIPKNISETVFALAKGKATSTLKGTKDFNKAAFLVPKTIFNGTVSPKRTWGTAILSFERIYALKKVMQVSVNDIVLAICAGGLRKYLLEKEQLPSQPLVANVPISIRSENKEQEMNNQISNMLVRIATHIDDPIERLEYIHEQTLQGKKRHKAMGAKTLAKMADSVPFGLANLATDLYSKYNIKELHRPPFNVTITNVPGPKGLLYLKGHKIVSIFGLTPVLDNFGLIIAAFSYNGQVTITTTSDAKTMPDADSFSKYIRDSANELEKFILRKGKTKVAAITVKAKSALFFAALKKYLKDNSNITKNYKGRYHFEVTLDEKIENWSLDLSKKEAILKKKNIAKPDASISISDENLFFLYKGKLLLDELKIQQRIKLKGAKKQQLKLMQFIALFLAR